MKFEKHIFICTNQRAPGEKKSCGEACGLELITEFKKRIKDQKLTNRFRAQRAGCLDACEYGPSLVVYPEGTFYGGVQTSDVKQIFEEHLLQNQPVKRLVIEFENVK